MMLISKKNQTGFTLMEIVVGLALFGVALIALTDIYLLSQKTQNKLVGETRIQADARFVMEVLAREIRMNLIDYTAIDPADFSPALGYLPLIDVAGNRLVFMTTSSPAICEPGTASCLAVKQNDSAWASITPRGVNILKSEFYIYPEADPYTIVGNQYAASSTPRVTIILSSENITSKQAEKNIQNLQTTVSSRVYKRF